MMTIARRALLSLTLAAICATGDAQADSAVQHTNARTFRIPFEVDTTGAAPDGVRAVLFVSVDGGPYVESQAVELHAGGFEYTPESDGLYQFSVRVTDAQGRLPDGSMPSAADLSVRVDTTAPGIVLSLREAAPGTAELTWSCDDPHSEVSIETAEGPSGRWQAADVSGARGTTTVTAAEGSVLMVRASAFDPAGNRAEKTDQLVLSRNAAPDQGDRPLSSGSADQGMVLVPGNGSGTQNQNPFSGNPSPFGRPAVPANSRPVPSPGLAPSQMNGQVPAYPSGYSAADRSAGNLPEVVVVNDQHFDIEYAVDSVGPSGVSAVELFVTEDGGRQWFRYGNDADLRSPFRVDSMGEGTFGFAVRVRNGLGIADPPPQSGEAPEIVVSVDKRAPGIEFARPVLGTEAGPVIEFNWRVYDDNPAPRSVRLEYAASAVGPWMPVFDWSEDAGRHRWPVQPGSAAALYFRLLARDAAGNVASYLTPEPVLIDQTAPVGRLLRVRPSGAGIRGI